MGGSAKILRESQDQRSESCRPLEMGALRRTCLVRLGFFMGQKKAAICASLLSSVGWALALHRQQVTVMCPGWLSQSWCLLPAQQCRFAFQEQEEALGDFLCVYLAAASVKGSGSGCLVLPRAVQLRGWRCSPSVGR